MPPRREYHFWVYIIASRYLQLYVCMTNSLRRRVAEHKARPPGTYTARYNIDRLVYFEYFRHVQTAIAPRRNSKIGTAPRSQP